MAPGNRLKARDPLHSDTTDVSSTGTPSFRSPCCPPRLFLLLRTGSWKSHQFSQKRFKPLKPEDSFTTDIKKGHELDDKWLSRVPGTVRCLKLKNHCGGGRLSGRSSELGNGHTAGRTWGRDRRRPTLCGTGRRKVPRRLFGTTWQALRSPWTYPAQLRSLRGANGSFIRLSVTTRDYLKSQL